MIALPRNSGDQRSPHRHNGDEAAEMLLAATALQLFEQVEALRRASKRIHRRIDRLNHRLHSTLDMQPRSRRSATGPAR